MRPGALLCLALLLPGTGCHGGGGGDAAAALISVAIAGSVAGVRRAGGDCYTPCNTPYSCNPESGLCELPCGGECQSNEVCGPRGICTLLFTAPISSSTVAATR